MRTVEATSNGVNEAILKRLWKVAGSVLVLPVIAASIWGPRVVLGVFAGGAWNLVNLWCLTRLLTAWLGPHRSTKRVVTWLVVKFLLLYVVVVQLMLHPSVSIVGFGVGFSIVLVTAMTFFACHARGMVAPVSHDPTHLTRHGLKARG